jgi:hypothetical protein
MMEMKLRHGDVAGVALSNQINRRCRASMISSRDQRASHVAHRPLVQRLVLPSHHIHVVEEHSRIVQSKQLLPYMMYHVGTVGFAQITRRGDEIRYPQY